MNIGM